MPSKRRWCRFLFRAGAHTAKAELRIVVDLAVLLFVTQFIFSETPAEAAPSAMGAYGPLRLEPPTQNLRAFPQVSLGGDRTLEYLGTFYANAEYKKSSKFIRALEKLASTSRSTSVHGEDAARQTEVPGWMILPARRVVEDFEPPAYAKKIARPTSILASIRDELVTLAYGRARVMGEPHQVTTDSMLRVVISDPDLRAVHVFDPEGKTSFSILGDQGRRLQVRPELRPMPKTTFTSLIPSGEWCWSITSTGNSSAISGGSVAKTCMNVQPELPLTATRAVYILPIPRAIWFLSSICKATF